jgi:hypothetical protein
MPFPTIAGATLSNDNNPDKQQKPGKAEEKAVGDKGKKDKGKKEAKKPKKDKPKDSPKSKPDNK